MTNLRQKQGRLQGAPSTTFAIARTATLPPGQGPLDLHLSHFICIRHLRGVNCSGCLVYEEASRRQPCRSIGQLVSQCLPSCARPSRLRPSLGLGAAEGQALGSGWVGAQCFRCEPKRRTFTYPSRCCSIACYVLFSVLSFLRAWLSHLMLRLSLPSL